MVDRSIFKCDCLRCTPQSILSAYRANEQLYIDTPGEDSVISLKDSFLEIEFDVLRKDDNEKF